MNGPYSSKRADNTAAIGIFCISPCAMVACPMLIDDSITT